MSGFNEHEAWIGFDYIVKAKVQPAVRVESRDRFRRRLLWVEDR